MKWMFRGFRRWMYNVHLVAILNQDVHKLTSGNELYNALNMITRYVLPVHVLRHPT
jgi:hypothetical protein